MLLELVHIGMQGSREEEKSEHDFEQNRPKINFPDQILRKIQQGRIDEAGQKEAQGEQNGREHQPNGVGQLEQPKVNVAEQGGKHNKDGGNNK